MSECLRMAVIFLIAPELTELLRLSPTGGERPLARLQEACRRQGMENPVSTIVSCMKNGNFKIIVHARTD